MNKVFQVSAVASLMAAAAVVGAGCGGGGSNGSSNGSGSSTLYVQQERLARPVVNEVLATFADNRHFVNDSDNPTDDPNELQKDIESFLTFPAGRSTATKNVIKAVLVPDVMVADLSQPGEAAYLGSETGGKTSTSGSKFGGRKLRDDVVDISLGIIFGNTVSALGLAPDDGKEIPTLTSDNVSSAAHQYSATFPYLGTPH